MAAFTKDGAWLRFPGAPKADTWKWIGRHTTCHGRRLIWDSLQPINAVVRYAILTMDRGQDAEVTLKPDVVEQVRRLAEGAQSEAEAIVDEALRLYLAPARQQKLEAETRAFEQQRATLATQYPREYVAIHSGQVIDHDPDLRALHLRVFAKLAHIPVLLKLVTENADRDLVIRSRRFERPTS